MSVGTPDSPDPLAIIHGEYDSVLGLNTASFLQVSFKSIMKEDKLPLELLCAVLKRHEIKYTNSADDLVASLKDFEFPQCHLVICERTFAAHLQWLLLRGAKLPNSFWRDVGLRGGTILLSALQLLQVYTKTTWAENLPRDLWAQLLHGVMIGVDLDASAAELIRLSGKNSAPSYEKSLASKKQRYDPPHTIGSSVEKKSEKTTSHDPNSGSGERMPCSHAICRATSASTVAPFRKSDLSPEYITVDTAKHMCRTCLAVTVMAIGSTAKEAPTPMETYYHVRKKVTSEKSTPLSSIWATLSLLLRQPTTDYTHALLSVYLSCFSDRRRSEVYQTKLRANNSEWMTLLASYIRSGGEITVVELQTMDKDTVFGFLRSLTAEWLRKNEELGKSQLETTPEPLVDRSTQRCNSIEKSLFDPSGTGFCAVVKCGDTESTQSVISILLQVAQDSALSHEQQQGFRRAAAGVARWRLSRETGMGWGSGAGPVKILDGEAGELRQTRSLLMSTIGYPRFPFADDSLDGESISLVVLEAMKELCCMK